MVSFHTRTGTRQGLVGIAAACLALGLITLGSIVCRAEPAPAEDSKKTVTSAADVEKMGPQGTGTQERGRQEGGWWNRKPNKPSQKENVTSAASTETPRIDAADPASWEASVAAARRNLDDVVDGLISIGKDEKRSAEDRRNAIFLLGAMETKESLAFLIDNIGLDLPLRHRITDADMVKGMPCMHAMDIGESWKTAQAILASLDKPKSNASLGRLGSVLKLRLSGRFARAVIDEELSKARSLTPQRRKNLEEIRRYVALD